MGLLRLLLAICVIASHTNPIFGLEMLKGDYAVEIFFMISGFYMSIILNEKYKGKGSYATFISNRFLKIYPTYYVCTFIILITSFFFLRMFDNPLRFEPYIQYFNDIPLKAQTLLILSNIVIFGQDVVMFTGVDIKTGSFFFTNNFRISNPQLWNLLLNPPAWSISVELMFYLIAPLIVRKSIYFIFACIAVSFTIKFYIINILGWNNDPWTYRFFFSELYLFLLGSLSYKLITQNPRYITGEFFPIMVLLTTMAFIVFYQMIDIPYKSTLFLILFFIATPCIFNLTKNSKIDRYIGELSYPVYLIHWLISASTYKVIKEHMLIEYRGEIVMVISILVAILILHLIIKPIDLYRQKRAASLKIS
ncbi:acyltransferase family protein [Enterobacter mori]|uniref:acyltransferase family protein n=1 Tax=Enterobacter mori TaxID=539813 RepID=UPI001C4889A8|nr:acyltransferase [Enterobacter mori]QXM22609.1 acyltransferase [Enterobacter mori]